MTLEPNGHLKVLPLSNILPAKALQLWSFKPFSALSTASTLKRKCSSL